MPDLELKSVKLTEDAYTILQRSESYTWGQIGMVKSQQDWRWEGRVNEHLMRNNSKGAGGSDVPPTLSGLMMTHHRRRDAKSFKNDALLLESELALNPDDTRSQFYLANTYKDMHDFDGAIINYVKRIKMGGWQEEVFMSAYSIAQV